jgi:hypothetical protein
LLEKNIPKVNKINTFLRETKLDTTVTWLFDPLFILNTVDKFIDLVGSKIYSFIRNGKKPIDIINNIDKFFNGISLFRIETEYPNIKCKGRELIKVLFERVHKELFSGKEIPNMADSKLIRLMNFLIKQKLFVIN